MKIYIITIHHLNNFGSVFQAWALNHFLIEKGYQCEVIDYRPAYFNYGRNKLRAVAAKVLYFPYNIKERAKFDAFIQKNTNCTSRIYKTINDLQDIPSDTATLFIAGGDQLWNDYHPCGRDKAFKLHFVKLGRKMAYGTSMGRNNFTEDELKKLAKDVADFECLMLREGSTVDMIAPFLGIPVHHVIDPVGLYDKDYYRSFVKRPETKEPYAVMYMGQPGELLNKAVEKLSKEKGLKIVHISGFRKRCYCDHFMKALGPDEILGYILHADFVISGSFHATMFSLLGNVNFVTLLPGVNTNERIVDLLTRFGLQERMLTREDDLKVIDQKIDFASVNKEMASFRKQSVDYLMSAIEGDLHT